MSDIIFSLIAPAVRKEFYKKCYDSFSAGATLPFEIVFVGNNPPTEEVGKNFRYIYSAVKPAQCLEIAARESEGKYIIPTADDIKYSENFISKVYQKISEIDTNKYLLSFMGFLGFEVGKLGDMTRNMKNYKKETYFGVEIGQCGCFTRDLWKRLGGIDKRFVHTFFDVDLHMRCYEIGMTLCLADNVYVREFCPKFSGKHGLDERKKWRVSRMVRRYKSYSNNLLKSFWINSDGTVSKKRLLPFEPFEDKDIKIRSQGEKGEWK